MLNLNHYRNAHFRTLDKAKKEFKDLVTPLIRHLPSFLQVRITYTYFAPSQQLSDTSNVTSIVDKFFCDALVECGKLTDDNRTVVLSTHSQFGGVDKANPRVEATIELPGTNHPDGLLSSTQQPFEAERQEQDLKITIIETEIQEAIRNHVRSIISVKDGMEITMNFSATRGEDGLTAFIDISPAKDGDKTPAATTVVQPQTEVEKPAPAVRQARQSQTDKTPTTAPAPEKVEEKPPFEENDTSSQHRAGGPSDAGDNEETVAGEKPLKASIFSGMRRPSSETPAEEAAA